MRTPPETHNYIAPDIRCFRLVSKTSIMDPSDGTITLPIGGDDGDDEGDDGWGGMSKQYDGGFIDD